MVLHVTYVANIYGYPFVVNIPAQSGILYIKKNLNVSRPSEHPPVRGENVKTFRWDHRLQI